MHLYNITLTASFINPSPNNILYIFGYSFEFTIVNAATLSLAQTVAENINISIVLKLMIFPLFYLNKGSESIFEIYRWFTNMVNPTVEKKLITVPKTPNNIIYLILLKKFLFFNP